ncbi:glycosyltransferase [Allocoprobacillus halotolerans]|uniref:Glycosyltransferase n=1 Tax=Allocoprobacillus halotolerans TaxID=2944914 RepID=A0ABY5I620_9FIRM|nr:glycosyltransferase [Allocoprobacillus halotolerans]UTY40797.1 glycosyltransferase [Allocoprobacillus halotolerans]
MPSDSTLLLSVGELNDNKNHKVIIQSLPELPSNVHYVICGRGPLKEQHEQLAKELHVENRLHLLGYRSDVIKIMKSCDIFVFPSKREGLSVALMEAMACGLPCIASRIRGNIDLITQGTNSILCNPNGYMNFVDVIISIDEEIKDKFSKLNIIESKKYSVKQISEKMKKMYLKGDIFHD